MTIRKENKEMSKDIQTEQESATSNETKRIGMFTRQPLSPLGKIAFWTFVVGGVGGLGGVIALTITSGAPCLEWAKQSNDLYDECH